MTAPPSSSQQQSIKQPTWRIAHDALDRHTNSSQLPVVLQETEHGLRPSHIELEALWILNRLHTRGFQAFIVGGSVRDLLTGHTPKDFDISTDATPYQITRLFRNSREIGRRFRIAHVYFSSGKIMDVSTFRALTSGNGEEGPLRRDNKFGTPEEDAQRRDLTINGLFYNPNNGIILDHVGGLRDLRQRVIRAIGDPDVRFPEDPVRMLRAVRHAARHQFAFDPNTWEAIVNHAPKFEQSSRPRLRDEFLREFHYGCTARSFRMMHDTGLLQALGSLLSHWLYRAQEATSPNSQRFGPFATTDWTDASAFWARLQTLDAYHQKGQTFAEEVRIALMFLPLVWRFIFAQDDPQHRTAHIWHSAYREQIEPILREITVQTVLRERIRHILNTYWRLHIYPQQQGVLPALRRSRHLTQALQLFQLELSAHQLPCPPWLEDLLPPS